MNDMAGVIQPKSDQLNADDLIGGPRTVTITDVKFTSAEQPISVFYNGDNGKPWKPCKSMARVMVRVWGNDSKNYVGRSLTLYRDDKVKWAGMAVGGIRISHMSHMDGPMEMALTESKGNRKPFRVQPLVIQEDPETPILKAAGEAVAKTGTAALETWFKTLTNPQRAKVLPFKDGWKETAGKVGAPASHAPKDDERGDEPPDDALDEMLARPAADETFPGDRP